MKRERKNDGEAEGQMVTVVLSRKVHKILRLMSVETGTPMSELIRNAVDSWLGRQTEGKSKRAKK